MVTFPGRRASHLFAAKGGFSPVEGGDRVDRGVTFYYNSRILARGASRAILSVIYKREGP
jgi:hypothetical protein